MPMTDAPYVLLVVQRIALAAILLVALSQLRIRARWWFGPRARQAQLGLIVGIVLVIELSSPLRLPSGTAIYGGASFVGVVGFLGGPLATAVTLLLAVPYRVWLGGPFLATGASCLLLIAAISLLYRRAVMVWSERPGYAHLPLLSLIVSLSALAGLTVVSPMQRTLLLHELGPSFAVATFMSVWLLGALLLNQQRRDEREGALDEARELLTSVTSGFPGVLYRRVLMPDGTLHYTYLSGAAEATLGVGAGEILADPRLAHHRIHPEDQEAVDAAIHRSAAALSPATIEHRVLRSDGKMRWIRDVSQPHRQADGAMAWDGSIVDVTEMIRGRAGAERRRGAHRRRSRPAARRLCRRRRAGPDHRLERRGGTALRLVARRGAGIAPGRDLAGGARPRGPSPLAGAYQRSRQEQGAGPARRGRRAPPRRQRVPDRIWRRRGADRSGLDVSRPRPCHRRSAGAGARGRMTG